MKEDVLEQIVEDYLQFEGYFTTHNIRFKPGSDRRTGWPDARLERRPRGGSHR